MEYEYTIEISQHLYKDLPIAKVVMSAQKILNRVKKYAPIETGHLQDSIQIKTEDLDNAKLTIYINKNYFASWDTDTPYYKYLDESPNKHYRRGTFKGDSTIGWWGRLCDAFEELWKKKADTLENYERKENDTSASASEHRTKVEKGEVDKLKSIDYTEDQMRDDVDKVTQQDRDDYNATHKALRKTTYERKGYIATQTTPIKMMSVKDLQFLSAENMQYLLQKELGVDITIGYAQNKRTFYKMKRELLDISKELGEILIGGIPTRTIIRELIRKLYNSEQMNAY